MSKILIVDDDPSMTAVLSELFKTSGHEAVAANSAPRAMELFKQHAPDLVITDIEMPEGKPTGLKLLAEIKELGSAVPVIVMTGQGTKERAVEALRAGAQDFIEKPFHIDEMSKRVENALLMREGLHALVENVSLKKQLNDKFRVDHIVGSGPAMQEVYRLIQRIADTDSTVLIRGESGTGKELVARALHYNSRRAAMPFVAINCAAMPEHLLESELFGHRKGAFTGAVFDRAGLFQAADRGTVFLDEIGSMPASLQGKLLRFLQEKELRRVGDTETIKVDVRVVAATNEPLEEKMRDRSFREDLFYRLSVIPIQLPPLRQRIEDLPLLIAHFLKDIAIRQGIPPCRVSEGAGRVLHAYHWPGNVRELQNSLERACALCEGGIIQASDLPERLQEPMPVATAPKIAASLDASASVIENGTLLPLKEYLHLQAVAHIQRALRVSESNREKAAHLLGVSPATLYRKLNPNGADDEDEAAAPPGAMP